MFSREALLERIWGDSAYRDPRTIDVHIRHLREKIERDAKEPEYIFTVRGVGYRFRDRDSRVRPAAGRAFAGPRRLGSIRTRLAVFFFLITCLAVAVVYVYVGAVARHRVCRGNS